MGAGDSRLTDSEAEGHTNARVAGNVVDGVAAAADDAEVRGIRPVSRRLPPVAAGTAITVSLDDVLGTALEYRILKIAATAACAKSRFAPSVMSENFNFSRKPELAHVLPCPARVSSNRTSRGVTFFQ